MNGKSWPVLVLTSLFLTACADPVLEERFGRAPPPTSFFSPPSPEQERQRVFEEDLGASYRPMSELSPAQEEARRIDNTRRINETRLAMQGCSIGDRFDRSAALAYDFKDNRSRLAFHVSLDGGVFEPMEVERAMIRFTHKLGPTTARKNANCLYPSGFQGLIGSGINEFVHRKDNTVWQQLRSENPLGVFD